jgi:hypothetical protein
MAADIIRKNTTAYQIAKILSDKRRKGKPVGRKELMEKLGGIDPAPYVKMYECFQAVSRGKYIYVGENLKKLEGKK